MERKRIDGDDDKNTVATDAGQHSSALESIPSKPVSCIIYTMAHTVSAARLGWGQGPRINYSENGLALMIAREEEISLDRVCREDAEFCAL